MNTNDQNTAPVASFFDRVIQNDATKRGLAGAAAGLLVGLITEAIWPSA